MFSCEHSKLFETSILKNICERMLLKQLAILKSTNDQLLLTLLLNSKNLLASCEQLSCYQLLTLNNSKLMNLCFIRKKLIHVKIKIKNNCTQGEIVSS